MQKGISTNIISALSLLVFLCGAFCSTGQTQMPTVNLTSKDADPKSVRVITTPDIAAANLVFKYVGKTSEEIEAIRKQRPVVQVMKNGSVVAETGAISFWDNETEGKTTHLGLVLIFSSYAEAKEAEKALRGE